MAYLLYEEKIRENKAEFKAAVIAMALRLQRPAEWFMRVFDKEAGLDHKAVNTQPSSVAGYSYDNAIFKANKWENVKLVKPAGTSDSNDPFTRSQYRATGLIQFMPATARELGTTTQALYKMTNVQQLYWVEKYYRQWIKYINSFEDMYLITFYPVAVKYNWPDNKAFPDSVYKSNKALDEKYGNNNGVVTVGEFRAWALSTIPSGYLAIFTQRIGEFISEKKKES